MSAFELFILVFCSQLILMSYYIPRKILQRMRFVIEHLPPSVYPKLYNGENSTMQSTYQRLAWFNRLMLVVGGLIIGYLLFATEQQMVEGYLWIIFGFGMLQAMPVVLMDFACLKQYKAMRDSELNTKRKVNLNRKSIFNHTSPQLLALTGAVMLIAMIADLYFHGFDTSLGIDLYEGSLILIAAHVFFAWVVRWRVYGKKLNPYQDAKDEAKEIDTVVMSALTTSMSLSVFMATMSGINAFELDQFEPVIMSLYLQAIFGMTMLYGLRHQNITKQNFDVYKADPAA